MAAYYDSLRLFTPAHLDSLPGRPFPGDPNRYPTRDEVADYLRQCAKELTVRTGQRVHMVSRIDGGYRVQTTEGAEFTASVVIAASGMFGNPHRPNIPALNTYTGKVMHSADYRSPEAFAGQRVVVIGSGIRRSRSPWNWHHTRKSSWRHVPRCAMRPPSRFPLIPGSGVTAYLTNR